MVGRLALCRGLRPRVGPHRAARDVHPAAVLSLASRTLLARPGGPSPRRQGHGGGPGRRGRTPAPRGQRPYQRPRQRPSRLDGRPVPDPCGRRRRNRGERPGERASRWDARRAPALPRACGAAERARRIPARPRGRAPRPGPREGRDRPAAARAGARLDLRHGAEARPRWLPRGEATALGPDRGDLDPGPGRAGPRTARRSCEGDSRSIGPAPPRRRPPKSGRTGPGPRTASR